jgi:hypothetical protein
VAGSLLRYAMLAVPLSAASIVVGCGHPNPPAAQLPSASPVGVELKAAQPTYPTGTPPQISVVLHNNGPQACALPSVADGSVEVVSVARDGAAVVGRPGREHLFSGMAAVVALGLRTVDAGQSIAVPLDVQLSSHGSPVLTTSQQTAVDEGRVTLAARSARPISSHSAAGRGHRRAADRPQQCAITSTPASVEFRVMT